MKAFFQPLSGILRAGPDTDEYGKSWDYAVTVVSSDPAECTLLGLKGDGGLTAAHLRAAVVELRRFGFLRMRWERKKVTGDREIKADLG
jgi:hypothetical protein